MDKVWVQTQMTVQDWLENMPRTKDGYALTHLSKPVHDADTLVASNFDNILEDMQGQFPGSFKSVKVKRYWVLAVKPDKEDAVLALVQWFNSMYDYPVVDDIDYANRQVEANRSYCCSCKKELTGLTGKAREICPFCGYVFAIYADPNKPRHGTYVAITS